MANKWWLLLHLAGVFGFLAVHGVSMTVAIRLRRERDAAKINALLDTSGRTVPAFYTSFLVLLAGGIGATFAGSLWSQRWIWAAIATLVVVTLAMFFMARPYYQRVRFISRAVAEGSKAVTDEQFDSVLRDRRPWTVTWIGIVGLAFILFLMVVKPTLGMAPPPPPKVPENLPVLRIASINSLFVPTSLTAPAGQRFVIRFDNRDSGIPHNVAVYTDATASRSVFVGALFPGVAIRNYTLPIVPAGTYFFRCDVHPTTMIGSLEVK